MAALAQAIEPSLLPTILHTPKGWMTDDRFIQFCQVNPDWRLERTAEGDIVIMPPAFPETGYRNLDLGAQLFQWTRRDRTGRAFDSSTGFKLPDGAILSPDASWISKARFARLSKPKRQKFWQICPDFVVELRSSTERLSVLQDKMKEYMANGAHLGWLIDPLTREVHVYRPRGEVRRLKNPRTVSGDPVLRGFILDLTEIWDPDL